LEPLSGYLILGDKLMNRKLKSKIIPSWNFGPLKKNCKKVRFIVDLLIKEWGTSNQKIQFKKNKNFHESKLLSLNIEKAKRELLWLPKLTLGETIKFTIDWYKYFFLNKKSEDITNHQIDYYTDK
jgi:dTDP-D-glucose 4,6-dehydratase